MAFTTSPNMSLIIPTIGLELSPTWAQDLNNSLNLIDQHDHSPGNGVPIVPAGLNINADLPFNNNNAISLRSSRYVPQSSPINLGTDIGCLYVAGVDLYFNDVNGNQIQLTQSGSIAGTSGSITNLVSPASVTYVPGTPAFVFQSAALTSANLDGGSITLRNNTPSSFGIQINAPVALGANYSLTLPATLPGSTLPLSVSNSGNISAGQITTPQITDLSITTAKINAGAITSAKLDTDLTITGTFEADHLIADTDVTIDGQLIEKNASFNWLRFNALQLQSPSFAALVSGGVNTLQVIDGTGTTTRPLVVSANPTTSGLMVVRGNVDAAGTISAGEGFTVGHSATGQYVIVFNTPFQDTCSVTVTNHTGGFAANQSTNPPNNVNVQINTFVAGTPTNIPFSFIAIGQRG